MISIPSFIHDLQLRGIELAMADGRLVSRALPGAIDADTADLIRAYKGHIVDYLTASRNQEGNVGGASAPSFWAAQLGHTAEFPGLPLDRPRAPSGLMTARTVTQPIDSALLGRLNAFAQQQQATLFDVLHSALALLLARWCGSDEIVILTADDGAHERQSGLPLHATLSESMDFAQFLAQNRERHAAARAHRGASLEHALATLKASRGDRPGPLFPLRFSRVAEWQREGKAPSAPGAGEAIAHELEVLARYGEAGLTLEWTFAHELLLEPSVRRMGAALALVLDTVSAAPHTALHAVPLLTLQDRAQLAAWNETAAPYRRDACLHHLIEEQAHATPTRIALVCGQETLSYRALNEKANALALEMERLGVSSGDIVPIVMSGGLAVPLSFLASMKLGAQFAPLDRHWPQERLLAVLRKIDAPLVLADAAMPFALPGQLLLVDPASLGSSANVPRAVTAQMPLYMVHTSGSTGEPKAAINRHMGIVNRLSFMNRYFGASADEVVLQTTNHCFDSAVWQFFWPLINGGKCILPETADQFDLAAIVSLVVDRGVTLTDFTPTLLVLFAEHMAQLAAPRGSECRLRAVIAGGEELTRHAVRQFQHALPGVKLHNFYGPSETSIGVLSCEIDPDDDGTAIPIGRPIDNVRLAVVDRHLAPVPIGVAGELLIGGDCVGAGYFANPNEHKRRFIASPDTSDRGALVYRSGDLVRYRWDGQLEFLGRIDTQVKLRGFRIELGEIQCHLERQPGVRQAVVTVAGEGEGKRLIAYVVRSADEVGDTSQFLASLQGALAHVLPEYMVPTGYVVLDRIPVGASGKTDVKALLQHVPAMRPAAAFVAPATPHEQAIAKIWSELFGNPSISVTDDFFELGGHSLLATQFVARVRRQIERELPLRVLFDNAQLGALAAWLDAAEPVPAASAGR